MKIGVIIAMDKEFQRIKELLVNMTETTIDGNVFVYFLWSSFFKDVRFALEK